MNVGICSWAFHDCLRRSRSVFELTSLAQEFGFSSLEAVFHPRGVLGPDAESPDGQLAVPIRSLATLELHRFHLTDSRLPRRAHAFDILNQMIDSAKRWQIPSLSFSPGLLEADQNLDSFLKEIKPEFESVLQRAAAANCQVALENLVGHCVATRRAMAQALDHLGSVVGVCLDISNAMMDPPVSRWVQDFGPRITKIHLSDRKVRGGKIEPTLPGYGDVPWKEVRDSLSKIKDRVDIFVEVPLPPAVPERVFLKNIREAVDSVWLT